MTPNIDDIRRDDELLDTIGGRHAPRHTDAAGEALQEWVREIDGPDRPRPVGRYARRRTRARVGVIAAITVGTLSVSGVAAAVSGFPGLAQVVAHMGFVHRSADFGSGAAAVSTGSVSATAPTSQAATAPGAVMPSTGIGMSSSSDPSALPRVLPGAVLRATCARHTAPAPSAPGRTSRPEPSSTATVPPSSPPGRSPIPPVTSSARTSPSSGSSATSTSSSRPAPSSSSTSRPTKPHPTKPPKPTHSPSPSVTAPSTAPLWSPSSTPSATESATSSTTTSHGSSGSHPGN